MNCVVEAAKFVATTTDCSVLSPGARNHHPAAQLRTGLARAVIAGAFQRYSGGDHNPRKGELERSEAPARISTS